MNTNNSSAMLLEQLYHHIALPRQLPKGENRQPETLERLLADRSTDALRELASYALPHHYNRVDDVRSSVQMAKSLNHGRKLSKSLLLREMAGLSGDRTLILHVTEQNAGLLIYLQRDDPSRVVFEVFEASPASANVLASPNALLWNFPGCAVSLSVKKFQHTAFQDHLATFLEKASIETINKFTAKTIKAGAGLTEVRDTCSPVLISGMLMTLLEANGWPHHPPLLRKRIHDDVCWDEAHKPWRRLPFWLVLRVAVQRQLYNLLGPEIGRAYYKHMQCILIARFIQDAYWDIQPQSCDVLLKKLGRRLAKLEADRTHSGGVYDSLLSQLRPVFAKSIRTATTHLERQWNHFKKSIRRPILSLPQLAPPQDLILRLPHSGNFLRSVLEQPLAGLHKNLVTSRLVENYEASMSKKPFMEFVNQVIPLMAFENVEGTLAVYQSNETEQRCTSLAANMSRYIEAVGNAYDDFQEVASAMLLAALELWILVDQLAVTIYPLLRDYHPGLDTQLLDALHLISFGEMERAHKVQKHLMSRCQAATGSNTIFDGPSWDCFAVRYYWESPGGVILQQLREKIEHDAEARRASKCEELRTMTLEYEDLMRRISETPCLYTEASFSRQHDDKRCRKCYLERQARRMKIKVYEHPLPADEVAAVAAVFELECPLAFAAYRDITWLLLSRFVHQHGYSKSSNRPHSVLRDDTDSEGAKVYSELRTYARETRSYLTLGSTTKSHLQSHYNNMKLPVDFREIDRPCGLRLRYYDTRSARWVRLERETRFKHFPITLPTRSPFEKIVRLWGDHPPTSYEILANQLLCPPDLNVHEFMAWQSLLSGTETRWICLLRELGSSSINFSTQSALILVTYLVLENGPATQNGVRRDVHSVLTDSTFCEKLLDQVNRRIEGIRRNFREPVHMEMLLTILFKIFHLCTTELVRDRAVELVLKVRAITWEWTVRVRTKIQSGETEASKQVAGYAIWAPLLCKRTYQALSDQKRVAWATRFVLDFTTLRPFIGACIALQDNLHEDVHNLPFPLRSALLRDIRMMEQLEATIRTAIQSARSTLLDSIAAFWPVADDTLKQNEVLFLSEPSRWIQIKLAGRNNQHYIHYHYVLGHLIIDGKPLGKLPAEYRRSGVLQELFGDRELMTYPSSLPGMSFVLAQRQEPYNQQIHIGFRGPAVIVRAVGAKPREDMFVAEYVPRAHFGNMNSFDLPTPLIRDCYHWIDLRSGILEVRQSHAWRSKPSNWRLNVRTQQATRRTVTLVDPTSPTFKAIVRNFHHFENPTEITAFQPLRKHLSVEIRRLELSFVINRRGRMVCKELRCEVEYDQDIGTWYGLHSKLAMRSIDNHNRRKVLVPVGEFVYRRQGAHTVIKVLNTGQYVTFEVNETLGRIECAAEPKLLMYRALWHALTSYFIPDPLTGRTGTDEALAYLTSGAYQPWDPLVPQNIDILFAIAKLAPSRHFYPSERQQMEQVVWNDDLTSTIQDDRLPGAVLPIWQKSSALNEFSLDGASKPSPWPEGIDHNILRARAIVKLHKSAPLSESSISLERAIDLPYRSRDQYTQSKERDNVFLCVAILDQWPDRLLTTAGLSSVLQQYPTIGGFVRSFDKVLLSNQLEADLAIEWGALVNTCRAATSDDKFALMFLLGTIAFSTRVNMDMLKVLLAYALLSELKGLDPPAWPSYSHFRANQIPTSDYLMRLITSTGTLPGISRQIAAGLLSLWPNESFSSERFHGADSALAIVQPEWSRMVRNFNFYEYLTRVQHVLDRHSAATANDIRPSSRLGTGELYPCQPVPRLPSLSDLLQSAMNCMGPGSNSPMISTLPNGAIPSRYERNHLSGGLLSARRSLPVNTIEQIRELQAIADGLITSDSFVQTKYGERLGDSIQALQAYLSHPTIQLLNFDHSCLSMKIQEAGQFYQQKLTRVRELLTSSKAWRSQMRWLQQVGLCPTMTVSTLLQHLRTTSPLKLSPGMKETLIDLGLSLTTLQRLLRIQSAVWSGNTQQYADETANCGGHQNWDAMVYPDWLLLEIDANLLIRTEQVDVALATIRPASNDNSVVQLLMGKGKTSVILPMAACVLPEAHKLLRIIVPRALLLQSAQVMQIRLGGLVGRDITHVPFSRRTGTDRHSIETFFRLHKDIQCRRGVVLALPEHLLSFRLSGIQRMCDDKLGEAKPMVKIQSWFDREARDILDECDVSLAVRTQLIYPSGSQLTVDGHPMRWQVIQYIIQMVRTHLLDIQYKYPCSIEIVTRSSGGYPFIYFLRHDAEDELVSQLVDDICKGSTPFLRCEDYTEIEIQCIRDFISSAKVSVDTGDRITALFKENLHVKKTLYLFRGLFVHRILLLTLRKRWNVQYGLNPTRDPIAVPYHAKGVPSATAEWGHPDVAIILTALSFYYSGLSKSQLQQALEQLEKSDEPSVEYEKWISEMLPEALRDWSAINVTDQSQLTEIHQHTRFNLSLLQYYLNNFVFPKHAKQFKTKLQASGWDLVLFNPAPTAKLPETTRTTGFSGTNDGRDMLPLTIKQQDLESLAHTNAEVLFYLLQPRNREYVIAENSAGGRLSENDLLKKMAERGIRILIDSGAQILEHSNEQLAQEWLAIDHEAVAAVFFGDDNRAWVLYQKGTKVPLLASPFADNLVECVVYLDESHCRGTDMKLHSHARAALTLGPHLTKDALVQAAMRLRLLGQTQAVTFFAPLEVHQSIVDLVKKGYRDSVTSRDVIAWLVEQTCNTMEQLQPLYFSQGMDFCQRVQARFDNPDFLLDDNQKHSYLAAVQSKELQTLKRLYEPRQAKPSPHSCEFSAALRSHIRELIGRKRSFQDRGFAVHASALEEVEQEREVAFEIESVREVQKPFYHAALKFPGLHKDIASFINTGYLPEGSYAYEHVFHALKKTALGRKHRLSSDSATKSRLFVSCEFSKTVQLGQPNDNFLRPCQWILWSCTTETALIIIPEEADLALSLLNRVTSGVHLLSYAAPTTHRMLHFNDLTYYVVPPLPTSWKAPTWLKIEVGIFAGRLYFDWDERAALLVYLGVDPGNGAQEASPYKATRPEDESADGDVQKKIARVTEYRAFTHKPLAFLHEYIAVKRKGQDFEHTPMGFITTGKLLSSNHPFFQSSVGEDNTNRVSVHSKLVKPFEGKEDTVEFEVEDDDYDSDHEQYFEAKEAASNKGDCEVPDDEDAGAGFFN